MYNFTFRYTDGSYYDGQVADNGNFGTHVGETITTGHGSYYVYGKSGGTAAAAGTVTVSDYYDISTKTSYTPVLTGQGTSDGAAGLGSEQDETSGPGGTLPFGLGGSAEALQAGNALYSFDFVYADGSSYYGTVSDDNSFGYAPGQTIQTAYGAYHIYERIGYSSQPGGTVNVTSYYDFTNKTPYVPTQYAQGKTSGDGGLGFELDYTHGPEGDVAFGHSGALEARQAPNTLYSFSFTYADGSNYIGTVSDDGSFGYSVGETIPSAYGVYYIFSSQGFTSQPAGTVSVTSYYDTYSNQTYVPEATFLGLTDGNAGLGLEHDTTVGAAGARDFGDDGSLEATQAPYTSYGFNFQYTDGSFYYGTVSDPSGTYAAGQTILTSYGDYSIYGVNGITADAAGTVHVSTYYDISSRAFFTPVDYANHDASGFSDLGSEIDYTIGDGGTQKFGSGGQYEARQDATTLYYFGFQYDDGSFYVGLVADDGRYGYQVNEIISAPLGYYKILEQEGATSVAPGQVFSTLYYDIYSDLYPAATDPSPLYTPVYDGLGQSDGDNGLGSELDYIDATNSPTINGIGRFMLFGSGQYESKNPYFHQEKINFGVPPKPQATTSTSQIHTLLAAHIQVLDTAASDDAAVGTTLFSFRFLYADGSSYTGTVADDGSLGYTVGKTIAGTGGSYSITGTVGATTLAPGTVSVLSYFDITTAQVSTPDLFVAGKNAGTAGLGSEKDSIGGNHGTQYFGQGGAEEAAQGIAQFRFSFTYTDGSVYLGTVADDGSLGYKVGQTIVTSHGSYFITATDGTTGSASGTVAVSSYTDISTGHAYVPDGTSTAIGATAVVGAGGLGTEMGTITGPAGTKSFGQGGALEAKVSIASFRFQFTYADGSTYRGTVADDGSLGYSVGKVIAGTGGQYVITATAGPTADASGTVSVASYRDALSNLDVTPDLTASGAPDGAGGLGTEQDTITVGGVAHAFGQGGALEAGSAIAVYAFRFDYPDGSFYRGSVADDGSLGYTVGKTIKTADGVYTITGRNADTTFRSAGNVAVDSYFDATTGLAFVPDAGSVSSTTGLGSETGTITGNQGTETFGDGGASEASQSAHQFDFTFTYADGSAYTGTVADDGRYGYVAAQVIVTAHGSYRIGGSSATTTAAAGAVSVSRYLDAFGGGSFIPLATAAGKTDGSAGLGTELDMITQPIGAESFGLGGAFEASGGAPCYGRGTLIRTDRGDVAVEDLAIGDRIVTHGGAAKPIRWIGHRTVDCRRHPHPATVRPVRIQADAFGQNRPARDLRLSPDHAVYINEVLIPVQYLVNGTTIAQEARDEVTYYHIELSQHDVILAEGLPCESYLDTGNRENFVNGGRMIRLFPDSSAQPDATAAIWDAKGYAPLVIHGPKLDAARAFVDAHAAAMARVNAAA